MPPKHPILDNGKFAIGSGYPLTTFITMDWIKADKAHKQIAPKRRAFSAVINLLESRFNCSTIEFAAMVDIDYSLLTKYKNGKTEPGLQTILKMGDRLNMRPGEIIDLMEIND